MAHLLDFRPSAFDAFGLNISFKDPVVIYGSISLVFGYYLSKFVSLSERGQSLHPLVVAPRRIRANLRAARNMYLSDKKARKRPQTPKSLKSSARSMIIFGNIVLLPYRVIAALFVFIAVLFMFVDLFRLAILIWSTSSTVSMISDLITNI